MEHRYQIGDRVSLAFGFFDQDPSGTYEILALLPTRPDGDPQYRIRGTDDRQRVIGQAQIGEPGQPDYPVRPRSSQNPITDGFNGLREENDE